MRKLFTFLIGLFAISMVAQAAPITGGTRFYFTPNSTWKANSDRFAIYFFSDGDGDGWVSMTAVAGETDLYEAVSPAGKNYSNLIFVGLKGGTGNSWGDKKEQTADLTYDGTNNYYAITTGKWSYREPPSDPFVSLSLPQFVFEDEAIEFDAFTNVNIPIFIYSVKAPGSSTYDVVTSPYTHSGVGTYTVKVEVKATNFGPVLASDEGVVEVRKVPEPFTIKAKVPASWTNDIHAFVFGTHDDGHKPMTYDDGWWSITFTRYESANIIFTNGAGWDGGQTVDILNVAESICYQVNDEVGKKTVTIIPCEGASVTLSAPAFIYEGEDITLSASVVNVNDPVISYYVKAVGETTFVETTSPYTPTALGVYTFKAEVREGTAVVAESDEVMVIVKEQPADILIQVKAPATWDNVYLFSWGNDYAGHNEMTFVDGWYTITLEGIESIDFLFTNKGDWEDAEQSLNVEGVTQSTCYQINDGEGDKSVVVIPCVELELTDITIKVDITGMPSSQEWKDNVYIFAWGTNNDGFNKMTKDELGWYVFTFEDVYAVNFLLANEEVEGEGWDTVKKTPDVFGVIEDTCYAIVMPDNEVVIVVGQECDKDLSTDNKAIEQSNTTITVINSTIQVQLDGKATVALYSVSGQLVYQELANGQFSHTVSSGVYMLCINNDTHKVIVR